MKIPQVHVHTMGLVVHHSFQNYRFVNDLFDVSITIGKNRMAQIASCELASIIDDYAKDVGPGWSDINIIFTVTLLFINGVRRPYREILSPRF